MFESRIILFAVSTDMNRDHRFEFKNCMTLTSYDHDVPQTEISDLDVAISDDGGTSAFTVIYY